MKPVIEHATGAPLESGAPWRAPLVFMPIVLLVFGLLYLLVGTTLGRVLFPWQATGSLLIVDGQARGSALVAQPVNDPRYFVPRPSAADYKPTAVAGSNLARTNPDLRARMTDLRAEVATREGIDPSRVPGELLTQSGGGLDPHLSPGAAQLQVARVARARGLQPAQVATLVERRIEGPTLGLWGQPRVNVTRLNLDLDALATSPATPR